MGNKALEGLRVIDMTQFLAGPYCGMTLADLGADVIKVEPPQTGDFVRSSVPHINGVSMYFNNMNRNKKSLTINLKTPPGKKIFSKLIASADILVENNRPGVMERLGFDYEQAKKINDRLIYASISGYGQTGPYSRRPGYDLIAQALAGAMSITGMEGRIPLKSGIPIADILGGMNAAIGILAALNFRRLTGKGQYIDIALVDSIVSSLITNTMPYIVTGQIPGRSGNRYFNAYPYDSFTAKDGEYVLACGTNPHFEALANIIGMPELLNDERFQGMEPRKAHARELKAIIDQWSSDKTAEQCVEILMKAKIPVSLIYDLKQVLEDDHIRNHREMFVEIEDPKAGKVLLTGSPLKMSESPATVRKCAPLLGDSNEEILKELGYDDQAINEFENDHVI